jgi:hypothetical protein
MKREIQAFVFNWRGHQAGARRLEQALSGLVKTAVINSEEGLEAAHPHWVHLGEAAYFGAQWRRAVELFTGDLFLHLQADAAVEDLPRLLARATGVWERHRLGVYEPNVDFTTIVYDRERLPVLEPDLFEVPLTDCTAWLIEGAVVRALPPVDPTVNRFGWGIAAAIAGLARAQGRRCARDHRFTVIHPRGRGYSSGEARLQRIAYLRTLPLELRLGAAEAYAGFAALQQTTGSP